MLTNQHLFNSTISVEKRHAVPMEETSAIERKPIHLKQPLIDFLYSILVGAGAFVVFYGMGYWLFADPNPENGQTGGLILAPVMGILFFVFAWGYFGQRPRMPK